MPTSDLRQSLVALLVNSTTSFVAGATLASITGTLNALPGLLVLAPAAIGLRGNVFSALGNRLSTTVHLGTFSFSLRRESAFAQNAAAAMVLTLGVSLAMAVGAGVLVLGLDISDSPSVIWKLALVSILGGTLASLVVLAVTIGLTLAAVRFGWDLDNLVAPTVSTMGDVLTIPALWAAAQLVDIRFFSPALSALLIGLSLGLSVMAWRSPLDTLRRTVRESAPVLLLAAALSSLAGVALEKRLEIFDTYGALFVLQPAFVSSAGAMGGILASRLATAFQVGTLDPDGVPSRGSRQLASVVLALAAPVALYNAVGSQVTAALVGKSSPGVFSLLVVSLAASALVMVFVVSVAYYSTVVATRIGLDPDNYGTPVVTSSVDFVGALALIVMVLLVGIV
ncbi:MAG: magnesium transporter [Acidimicrobiales bacterium]